MDLDSLHKIGRLGKPWGHQGELTVHLDEVDLDDIVHAGSFFVDIEGQKVPFFFSRLHDKGRDVLVKFDDFSGVYLVHCHNLEHSDAGMARNFEVRA